MPQITIYTRPFCGYCSRAVALLDRKGVAYEEIEAGFDAPVVVQRLATSRESIPVGPLFLEAVSLDAVSLEAVSLEVVPQEVVSSMLDRQEQDPRS